MSTKNAGLAKKLGYTNIKVMLQGVPGWKKSGQSLVAAHDFVASGNIVLVDVRNEEAAVLGHIPRAVNVPFAILADMKEMFPVQPSAPIVLYGGDEEAGKAEKIVRKWGYKKVALVDGGLEGWQKAGGEVVAGPLPTEITWVRKPGKGEVLLDEFNLIVTAQPTDKVIVDVRTAEEIAAGMYPGAIHLPLEEIGARLAELPKDRELLVHCSTGARAEMAWKELVGAGLSARFLVATVDCDGTTCSAEE